MKKETKNINSYIKAKWNAHRNFIILSCCLITAAFIFDSCDQSISTNVLDNCNNSNNSSESDNNSSFFDIIKGIVSIVIDILIVSTALFTYYQTGKHKRISSFESILTQMLNTQRHIFEVVDKINNESAFHVFFQKFKTEQTNKSGLTSSDINQFYNDTIVNPTFYDSYPKFCNSFKFLYHEIEYVRKAGDNSSLKPEEQREYALIIQAQLTIEELFCFLINRIAHEKEHPQKKYKEFNDFLCEVDFFEDLCINKLTKESMLKIEKNILERYLKEEHINDMKS